MDANQILQQLVQAISNLAQPQANTTQGINLQPYDEQNETFTNYTQRLENYLEIKNLMGEEPGKDVKRVQILINCLGPKTYNLLTSLTTPDLPSTKSYKNLILMLKQHLDPIPNEIAEQHKFLLRLQKEGETICQYVAELKKLITNCNFNCSNCGKPTLNIHLRSQFIRGLLDNSIRERLLQQVETMELEDAVNFALAVEASKLESQQIAGNTTSYVNKIKKEMQLKKQTGNKITKETKQQCCYRCGFSNHKADKCKFKEYICNKCNKTGHLSKVCQSNTNTFFGKKKKANYFTSYEGYNNTEKINGIKYVLNFMGTRNVSENICLNLQINEKVCRMEFDTGAAVSTISSKQLHLLNLNSKLHPTTVKLSTYSGEIIKPIGVAYVRIAYNGKETENARLFVINKKVIPICGREWIRSLNLLNQNLLSLNALQSKEITKDRKGVLQNLLTEYKDLFTDEIGKIPIKCQLQLKENTVPVFMKPRPIPFAIKQKVEEEIHKMEKEGVIEIVESAEDVVTIFHIEQINTLPVTAKEITEATLQDKDLEKVYRALLSGNSLQNTIYQGSETELTLEQGCIFKGIRVIIPQKLQAKVLTELHEAHIGITKMKMLARNYCYWKGIDHDIEQTAAKCTACHMTQNENTKYYHPWLYSSSPWNRIHIDFAYPSQNNYFLIIVDAYSKWTEVFPMKTITTNKTIQKLREVFARFGLPVTVVSDNGKQFVSEEFQNFLRENGIRHKLTATYHPASNGQVERYVQTIKKSLKSMSKEPGDINLKLSRILMQLRKAPNITTQRSPAELFIRRNIRTKLDLLKPNFTNEMQEKQENSRKNLKKIQEYSPNETVLVRNYRGEEKWKYGKIIKKIGNLHYTVNINGNIIKRHVDQLKRRGKNLEIEDEDKDIRQKEESREEDNKYNILTNKDNFFVSDYPYFTQKVSEKTGKKNQERIVQDNLVGNSTEGRRVGHEIQQDEVSEPNTSETLFPEDISVRRSKRPTKKPDRLTYN